MNILELKEIFDEYGIPESYYALDSNTIHDGFVIEKQYFGWTVCYRERGVRNEEVGFPSENDACEYMKEKVVKGYLGTKIRAREG